MTRDKNTIVRHHLLEIILWPNEEDGTFRNIHNTAARLKELGIYNDFKMTIQMTLSEHNTLHCKGRQLSAEHKKKIGETSKGRQYSAEQRKKMSEAKKIYWEKRRREGRV